MKKKISIGEDLCNYIESLHYETNAMQDLLMRMKNSTDEELNEFWMNKYVEKYTEYNIAKQQLEQEYVIPKYGDSAVSWNLDFASREIEVEVRK